MKKLIYLLIIGTCLWFCYKQMFKRKPATTTPISTTLTVKNGGDTAVTVFLTVGGDTSWVNNVNGIFGITTTGMQGSFVLGTNDSVTYTSAKPIQGNISFGAAPINCPVGITLYEFCLNNYGTVNDAQETVEISCVAGVSCIGKMNLNSSNPWSATTANPNVTNIQNDTIGANTNLVGVYPYGCTNCTNTQGMPSCITTPEKADSTNICNVQRFAKNNGGTVTVTFLKFVK